LACEINSDTSLNALAYCVDVKKTMETGTTVFTPGLLASAHRGILYIDDVNLLDTELVTLLLQHKAGSVPLDIDLQGATLGATQGGDVPALLLTRAGTVIRR
jgi:hypothetical protein